MGQHFLIPNTREDVLAKMVAAAELKSTDNVLEIGPGFGVLTNELVKQAGRVVAVEMDGRLAEYLSKLKNQLTRNKEKLEIINEDILKISNFQFLISNQFQTTNAKCQKEGTYKIVSNLPYQITSPVLWKFLSEEKDKPELMVLMVQKEVGERICARPGEMSILAVMCQFYAECEVVALVSRENFWPAPEVESAIIKLKINNHPTPMLYRGTPPSKVGDKIDEKEFMRLVKIGFSAKRKMLKNNLANGLKMDEKAVRENLKVINLDEKIRAQDLGVEDWIKLFLNLKKAD
jgi:16S rRNA (adenine1518-N6/adenine1519-N6)-dimethyltransferase